MIAEMANIASECLKTPRLESIWSPRLRRYVCLKSAEGREALVDQSLSIKITHMPINPQFKLVFLTAVIGTLLFIVLCLVLSLLAGKQPPPLFEKVIMGFFDLAKIGFGAVAGLLGGKKLQDATNPAAS